MRAGTAGAAGVLAKTGHVEDASALLFALASHHGGEEQQRPASNEHQSTNIIYVHRFLPGTGNENASAVSLIAQVFLWWQPYRRPLRKNITIFGTERHQNSSLWLTSSGSYEICSVDRHPPFATAMVIPSRPGRLRDRLRALKPSASF